MNRNHKSLPSVPGASFRRSSKEPSDRHSTAVTPAAPSVDRGPVQPGVVSLSAFNCAALAEAEPRALGVTYEFDAEPGGEPYSVTIDFEGRRFGADRHAAEQDRFSASTTVERVLPGSGRVAVTTRFPNLAEGTWQVDARASAHGVVGPGDSPGVAVTTLPRLPRGSAKGSTGWAPVISQQAPGVFLGSWAALVGLGAALGLGLQATLAAYLGLPVLGVLLVSVFASLIGLVGAKVYYLAVYPANRRSARVGGGMCIQGFVLGAAAAMIGGALVSGIEVGALLDITAPALMLGMTIGRVGCFFSGCCVGRPTASRWGLWSSDRRLGTRRIPTQLLESMLALAIGATAGVVLVTAGTLALPGVIFVGALAAYVLGRQLLLPLRAESRKTRYGHAITLALSGIVLVADLVVTVVTNWSW